MFLFESDLKLIGKTIPNISKIYLDMDGVLVDDVRMFTNLKPEIKGMESLLKVLSLTGQRQSYVIPIVKEAIDANSFRDAEETLFSKYVKDFLLPCWFDKNIEVEILTSTMAVNDNRSELEHQKISWLENNGFNDLKVNFSKGSVEKQNYAKEGHLLIDDYDRTIGQFRYKGGTAIHHTSFSNTLDDLKLLNLSVD